MAKGNYEHGYGELWQDVLVFSREGYTTSVADYHSHEFYEVNLILSGDVRILLADRSVETNVSHLVLTGPGVPHFISCQPNTLYRRLYLCFSGAFMERCGEDWEKFRRMFEGNGCALTVDETLCDRYRQIIEAVGREQEPYRRRLLILYLLSHLRGLWKAAPVEPPVPACVIGALSHIHKHYAQRLVAEELAQQLHVSRTTLMTAFKKHTGSTLGDYIPGLRVKQACRSLGRGRTVQETAEECGFADVGSMIRVFRKHLGMTPGQYRQQEWG